MDLVKKKNKVGFPVVFFYGWHDYCGCKLRKSVDAIVNGVFEILARATSALLMGKYLDMIVHMRLL